MSITISERNAFTAAVARELGWQTTTTTDTDTCVSIVRDARDYDKRLDHSIHLHFDTYRKKIEVVGGWPRTKGSRSDVIDPSNLYHPSETRPKVAMAMTATPQRAAAEIKRRFLPEYERLHKRCVERVEERDAYDDSTTTLTLQLHKAAGRVAGRLNNALGGSIKMEPSSFSLNLAGGYGDVQVSGDSVKMELSSLTEEQARAVLAALVAVKSKKTRA